MDTKKLAQSILDVHHTFAHRELATLDAQLLATTSDPAFRRAWTGLSNLFRDHMKKEEYVLFPAILAGHTGLDGPVMVMEQEHDELRAYEKELLRLSKAAGPNEKRLLAFLADLSEHARIEDEELFPAVHSPMQIAKPMQTAMQ
jgi:iron-sulfur cluster repair protein YtfE (RIC family)